MTEHDADNLNDPTESALDAAGQRLRQQAPDGVASHQALAKAEQRSHEPSPQRRPWWPALIGAGPAAAAVVGVIAIQTDNSDTLTPVQTNPEIGPTVTSTPQPSTTLLPGTTGPRTDRRIVDRRQRVHHGHHGVRHRHRMPAERRRARSPGTTHVRRRHRRASAGDLRFGQPAQRPERNGRHRRLRFELPVGRPPDSDPRWRRPWPRHTDRRAPRTLAFTAPVANITTWASCCCPAGRGGKRPAVSSTASIWTPCSCRSTGTTGVRARSSWARTSTRSPSTSPG